MNKQIKFFGLKSLIVAAICFLTFSNAAASTAKEQINALVIKNLAKKLQTDLAVKDVTVSLKSIEEYKISQNEIGLKGEGSAILIADEMPIRFDVRLNTADLSVSDIVYDFVEPKSEFAPSTNEEILMKELMKQISKDYQTDNIVIAIDGMEDVSRLTNKKEFTGVGEVRIGDFVWNKIKFDVVLDEQNKTAAKVIYKVEK